MTINIPRLIQGTGSAIAIVLLTSCALTPPPSDTTTVPQTPTDSLDTASSQEATDPVAPPQDVQKTTIVERLDHPWGMAWLPDGAILITERSGQLRIVRDGVLDPTPIPGVPEVLAFKQGGLMDISLHPRFSENSSYSRETPPSAKQGGEE